MADLNKIIDDLSSLTVVEAAKLSKQLEEKWGVTAAAAVAAAPAPATAPAEEKDEFTIVLAAVGDKKNRNYQKFNCRCDHNRNRQRPPSTGPDISGFRSKRGNGCRLLCRCRSAR